MSPRKFAIIDTETTGLDKLSDKNLNIPASIYSRGDEVCQIGGLICDSSMKVEKAFCYYCDTVKADSSAGALNVHGISMQQVRQYVAGEFLPVVLYKYISELLWDNTVFIGYVAGYDMTLIRQTLANSALRFDWKVLTEPVLPKTGRYMIDVGNYFKIKNRYRKLASFEDSLRESRDNFLNTEGDRLDLLTNCQQLISPLIMNNHNSFYDALNTYLLWSERVWKKKVF